jgi:hypothetical protein
MRPLHLLGHSTSRLWRYKENTNILYHLYRPCINFIAPASTKSAAFELLGLL